MIIINFDLSSGVAKLAQTTTIKLDADIPVQVVFSAAPGDVSALQVALGDDSTAPTVLAYTDTFSQDNETTWSGVLDASDTRLVDAMNGKGPTQFNLEFVAVIDGEKQVAPNLSITVQRNIISGPTSSEGGPTYLTELQTNTAIAAAVANLAPAPSAADILVNGTTNSSLISNGNYSRFYRRIVASAGTGAWTADYAIPNVPQDGAIMEVNVEFDASPNGTINIRTGMVSGAVIATAHNGSGAAAYWYGRFRFNSVAWKCIDQRWLDI